jgi:hypothetical protein
MHGLAAFFFTSRLPKMVAVAGFWVCEPHSAASSLLEQDNERTNSPFSPAASRSSESLERQP